MAQLALSLLGSLQISISGKPIKAFKSNRTRALLAYLAVEADRPHRRESLAGLLWPDWPDREALNNLRSTLSNLRLSICDREADPPCLLISRDSIQVNPKAEIWLDVDLFSKAVASIKSGTPITDQLEQAVGLYRGNFLEGFSIEGAPEFEEWALLTREQLARDATSIMQTLASTLEQNGDYSRAQSYVWRRIGLDPLDETAHQQIMRLLALSGQRAAALAQYESLKEILEKELEIAPSEESSRLYEQIRSGKHKRAEIVSPSFIEPTPRLPAFLKEEIVHADTPVFVSRGRELARLDSFLERALSGRGQVVFVTGEAGTGKTSLIQEFGRRSLAAHKDLCVAGGNCNAYTGIGDPYLPFREILDLLTGKVEARLTAGAITRDHALRLWNTIPDAVQALVEAGPDLIDTFLLREALLDRASMYAAGKPAWLTSLSDFLERKSESAKTGSGAQQVDLFEQYTSVLQILARKKPIILVIDDLQWADLGSISLLFHLGRRLSGNRILILGAYRPEDVSITTEGNRHPLESVINEFRRQYGELDVDVDWIENREFIDELLDSEPNRLGPSFRKMLAKQTGGHPLFTVELLRGMQERGDIIRDADQFWVEGAALDWDTVPARVDAALQERIKRLPENLQHVLAVASVEGEEFTAEVAAHALNQNEREIVQNLSSELVRKHRLVITQAIERLGSKPITHYRFRSYLLQKHLYDRLDNAERAYLHEDVGNALEELYGERSNEVAIQLARHFQEAKIDNKAIQYLQQAGDKAMQLSAYQEAITHISNALDLLMRFPDSTERANQELSLQISLARAYLRDIPSLIRKNVLTKARELCQQTGSLSQLYLILGELAIYHYVRAEYLSAQELAEESLTLALQTGKPLDAMIGHWLLGFVSYSLGKFSLSRAHLEQLISIYKPDHHKAIIALRGSDSGLSGIVYYACCLWCLGYPDQAEKYFQEAESLARSLNHIISTVEVLCFGGCMLNSMRRNWQAVNQYAAEMISIAKEKDFIGWLGTGMSYLSNSTAMLGAVQEEIPKTHEAIAYNDQVNLNLFLPGILHFLAQLYSLAGNQDNGLAILEQAIQLMEETKEGVWKAEIYRVKGQLLLSKNELAAAEVSMWKAIEIAREQEAKSWELRAAIDLCRLWQRQEKTGEAYDLLSGIYNWFTEGFDTADLVEAKKLLTELAA